MMYRVVMRKTPEGYSVSVPGLPGCWSQSSTESEAIENIRDAVAEYRAAIDEAVDGEHVREVEVEG